MRQVINKINGINFNASDDRHTFGDIYEKILKDLQSAGNAGEFYTPRAVTQFIVEQVNPNLKRRETIFDPACGTGGFLVCAIEHLRKQAKTEADEAAIQECFSGIEKKHLPHVLCMARDTNLHVEVTVRAIESFLRRAGRLSGLTFADPASYPWNQTLIDVPFSAAPSTARR